MSDKPSSRDRRWADRDESRPVPLLAPTRRAGDVNPVLVVDDEPAAVDIICRLLGLDGISARGVRSGSEALAAARSEPYDLILLDVMMPGMDGLEVCRELAADERTRAIPVIFLTARDDHATRAAGMMLGVSEFLTKPVNKQELYERVRAQLRNRALARRMDAVIDRDVPES